MDFYTILKEFHSGWAYLIITAGLVLFLTLSYYVVKKKSPGKSLLRLSFFTTMIFHIQLVFGALLYILSPYSKWNENTMSDNITRLYAVEHPLMMFAAVMFITIVNSRLKKSSEVKISNMVLVAAAMACILAMIPWHAWPGSN